MRNLLGRLNARTIEDLNEIADAWQTPLVGRDRLSQISQLYRAMTKRPMVRAQWDALTVEDQTAIRGLLEFGDAGATVDELAAKLESDPESLRTTCLGLYAQGFIAYEGSARTLPIGESPRLFVPIELGNAVRQIAREAQQGDISQNSFAELVALRSDQDIFDAASQWGIEFIPGVTTRAEVTESLTRVVTGGRNRADHIAKLGHDVRTVWERLTSVPQGIPIALDQIVGSGNERTVFNRRNAINELEDRFLAWSMVTDDGIRALFVPHELDSAIAAPVAESSLPKPVSLVGQNTPFRPLAPMAWDLMVLLQRSFGPLAPPNVDPLAMSREAAQDLNEMLWNRGELRPPSGYVELLIELAVSLRLLEEPQDGDSQFERTDETREWRVRSWDEQNSRIRRFWMASQYWIDGQTRQDVEPWNVDWRGFRIKLLNHLATLDLANWYRTEDVGAWIAEYDPGILGAGATVAISHAGTNEPRGEHARALGHLVKVTVEGVLHWLGLLQVVHPQPGESFVRIGQSLHNVVRAEAAQVANTGRFAISIADDLTVRISHPEPIHIWSLLAFADTVSLGGESVFRITTERLRSATAAGFRPEQIIQYLRRQKPDAVPDDFDRRIVQLSDAAAGLELTTALIIDAGQDQETREVRSLLESNGYIVSIADTRLYVTIGTLRPVRTDVERVHALLESAGFGPVSNRSRN